MSSRQGIEELRWVGALVGLAVIAAVGALVVGAYVGVPASGIIVEYSATIFIVIPLVVAIALFVYMVRAALMRVPDPLAQLRPFVAHRFGTPWLAAGTLAPILVVPLLMGAFGSLKQVMPLVAPFSWDDTFARLDRILFLGQEPWQITHAVFGSALLTAAIDRMYTLWVAFLFCAVLLFSTIAPRTMRARFFLSFGAAWLLIGVLGAFVFSSAGPCYAAAIGAASAIDYQPLMDRLREVDAVYPLGAVQWQGVLWDHHVQQKYGFAMGISAMPSMHNAITFLYLLAVWDSGRKLRLAAGIFAGAILIGSVHLAWHYAVDGLFAWAAVGAIWWAAGAYLRRVGYIELVGEPSPAADPEPAAAPALA